MQIFQALKLGLMDRGWAANPPHEAGRALGLISICRYQMAGPQESYVGEAGDHRGVLLG